MTFEALIERARRAGEARARRLAGELAERLRQEAPPGVGVAAGEAGVTLSGRALGRRLTLDPELRATIGRVR